MTQQIDDTATGDTPRAFDELRGEVSLMRAAIEGLTSARERIPDYSATLGGMSQALKATLGGLERIERSPAVQLSPDAMAKEILKAGATARAEDVRMLHEARDVLSRSIGRVDGIVERGQSAEGQVRRLWWSGAAGIAAGILLWSVLPGAIARSLPESWHVPEWMAARIIGADQQVAGERLIAVADGRHERNGELAPISVVDTRPRAR